MTIRKAVPDDLEYFVRAGREYAGLVGFDFNEEIYSQWVLAIMMQENMQCFVIPEKAHCLISLSPSMFGNDILAKVVTTWGRGGKKCFIKARDWAKARGATKIIADANLSPHIAGFYKSLGMKKYDTNYMGDL